MSGQAAALDVGVLLDRAQMPEVVECGARVGAVGSEPGGVSRELDPATVAANPITIIGDDPRVDLLTLAWSVRYPDAAPKAQRIAIDGVTIPFADLDTLIRTKQTGRFQDQADQEPARGLDPVLGPQ